MSGVWQDVRFATRLFVKEPFFTAVVVLVLAFGLGANATVFTFVNAALLRPLPFDEPDRIIALGSVDTRNRNLSVSIPDLEDFRAAQRSFEGLAGSLGSPMNLSDPGQPAEQFNGTYTSANTMRLIRQRPLLGRDFTDDDDRVGAEPAALISHGLWTTHYASDPNIIGRRVRINARDYAIVGVMGPGMKFPQNNDLWLPFHMLPPETLNSKRNVRNILVFGRLAPGVSFGAAQAELTTLGAQLARDHADTNKDVRPRLQTYTERSSGGPIRLIFLSLMGAVAFVLLIACANVANLLLARSTSRTKEIAVRLSLGAGRWRIIRQLLIESVMLSAAGGVLGLGLAVIGIRLFDAATADVGKPYWITFTLDPIVLLFLGAICIATGVLFGLAPALHITRTDLNDVLKDAGGRSGSGGTRARRWTSALVVVEIALTLILLAGAGFMVRSFLAMYRLDAGLDTSRLLMMNMVLPLTKYPQQDARARVMQQIEDRLRGTSTVRAAALATNAPMQGGFLRRMAIAGRPDVDAEQRPEVTMLGVSTGYFEAVSVSIARGRAFNDVDGTAGHESAIVNQRFVSMHFAGEDPIGRQITLYDAVPSQQPSAPRSATIVGIAPTIRQRDVQMAQPDPVVYLPYKADPQRGVTVLVQAPGDPGPITATVREAVRAVEPDVPLFGIRTLDQALAQNRWPYRVFGSMFAIFAVIALVLSAVGLYAVTAYSVTQRAPEIGIRMALGAQSSQVLWLVMRRAALQMIIGLPIGIAGAFGVGRLLESLLVQTSTHDAATLLSIVLIMIAVSVAACLLPARRATRLSPLAALR